MADQEFELKGKIEQLVSNENHRWFTGATIKEHLGRMTDMTVEFVVRNGLDMTALIGQDMSISTKTRADRNRTFAGIVVGLEEIGQRKSEEGLDIHYVANVRPWLWMLTRATNNRIFQEKTAVQIIEEVFGDHGFSDYDKKLTQTFESRDYCVQYSETDFDFVSRLMEEEGIYYYFDTAPDAGALSKLVLCDNTGAHAATPGLSEVSFVGSGGRGVGGAPDAATDVSSRMRITTGKITLNDYDMLTPTADLKVVSNTVIQSSHSHGAYENYHYPAKFRQVTARGNRLAEIRMQAKEVENTSYGGATTSRAVSVGYKFDLIDNVGSEEVAVPLMIYEAVHYFRPSSSQRLEPGQLERDRPELQYPREMEQAEYLCRFVGIDSSLQYRSPLTTPWPEIAGLHTATVVGKAGEEIWTDEHGRIRVHFPWDRLGEQNETSTCWVRVATPWSGKDYGLVAIPRMGQEVVIQFEEGDPDRPICTGMLWNNDTKPAWAYPDNATQLGIRTKSSKEGGAEDYNELMFEDKMGEEFMRVQAQKDHQFLIKNKSVVTIGQPELDAGDHDDEGSLSEVIRNHVTRTIQEGNHYHTIKQGDEEFKIETGSQTIEIETDKTQTIQQNYSTTIAQGDHTTEVSAGNLAIGVNAGKVTIEAMQSIELKVGASSIKIEPAQITVKSVMVNVDGSTMAEVKGGGMATLKSGGITMVQGGPLVKIN